MLLSFTFHGLLVDFFCMFYNFPLCYLLPMYSHYEKLCSQQLHYSYNYNSNITNLYNYIAIVPWKYDELENQRIVVVN